MKINNLTLINYRRFEHQSFVFNDHFTVLIGDNATGKTQVLQAIVTLLSQYQSKMLRQSKIEFEITENDVRHENQTFENSNGNHQVRMERIYPAIVSANLNGGEYEFCRKDGEDTPNVRSHVLLRKAEDDLARVAFRVRPASKPLRNDDKFEEENITLPVLAYYGTSRLWNKQNKNKEEIPSRTDGYRWSLDGYVDFHELVSWFMDQELIQLQKGTNDVPLAVMRKALSMMIPDCENIFYDFEFKTLVLEFEEGNEAATPDHCILFNDLSDGYRMVLTMVFDIVKQMITLNPHLGNETLEKTDGIILIDELDLSLHPKWQRFVVESLKKTFPLVQFIVTTHSPFIIQSLNSGEVIDLEACKGEVLESHWTPLKKKVVKSDEIELIRDTVAGIAWPSAKGVYENKSLEDVTEDVMRVPLPQRSARLQKMYEVAKQYYAKLKELKGASSEELEKLKNALDELSAPFSDDVAYHAFLEMERLTAMAEREDEK